MAKRVAIYARVSTDDKGQNPDKPAAAAARMVSAREASDRARVRRA